MKIIRILVVVAIIGLLALEFFPAQANQAAQDTPNAHIYLNNGNCTVSDDHHTMTCALNGYFPTIHFTSDVGYLKLYADLQGTYSQYQDPLVGGQYMAFNTRINSTYKDNLVNNILDFWGPWVPGGQTVTQEIHLTSSFSWNLYRWAGDDQILVMQPTYGHPWNSYNLTGTLILSTKPPIQPTPTPFCQGAQGTWRTVDLLSEGSLTDGSLTANEALVDGITKYIVDFSMTAPVPAMLEGYNAGELNIGIDEAGLRDVNYPASYIAEVNGNTFSSSSSGSMPIGLGGGNQITLHYHAEIPGSPSSVNTMHVATASIKIPAYMDSAMNLLCDSGMEQYPKSDYWLPPTPDGDFGRLNSAYQTSLENLQNGMAYCQTGMQAVGSYWLQTGNLFYHGQPIKQHFTWPGGVAQWKFRAAAGHLGAGAHVYIQDNAGTIVADLAKTGLPGFVITPIWQVFTGSVDLDASEYDLVLDMDGNGDYQTVYYDDVAIGTSVDMACQEDIIQITPAPSPTPTQAIGSPTPTNTLALTMIPTKTGTTTPTATRTSMPTTTARPTRTPTAYSTATNVPTIPPLPTHTPYGFPVSSITPGPPSGSATPNPFATPGPWDTGGDMPPEGIGQGSGDCSRPTNPWSISWWIDYEVCRAEYAVSWQPGHSATVVALPTMFANSEPFHTVNQVQNGVNTMKTEIADFINSNDAFVDSGPQTTNPDIFRAAPNSPWNGAPLKFGPLPGKGQTVSAFSSYCTSKMITIIGSAMGPGFCFVLNMFRDLGLLIWFQYLIDLLAMGSLIRQILVTIQFYPLYVEARAGSAKEANE